jgi:Na+/H+ antiporter NhaD/arsenite permease-like protein
MQAYISLSLDSTGLLRYLAFLVGNKYASSGSRLYLAFYAFFATTGLLIGNDPLILSGTPFLVYFTDHASIDPSTGFLFTHFQVSNLVSALLVSSNPTNLVLTSAFEISFLKYSAWTALPTVAAVIVLFPILRYYVFRGMVPKTLSPPHVRAADALNDKWGGIFGAVIFLITIVLLVGLSAGGKLEEHPWTGVWIVVLPAALCMLTWDCIGDLRHPGRREKARQKDVKEVDRPEASIEMGRVAEEPPLIVNVDPMLEKPDTTPTRRSPPVGQVGTASHAAPAAIAHSTSQEDTTTIVDHAQAPPAAEDKPRESNHGFPFTVPPFSYVARTFPTPLDTLLRMPWELVPFAFSMFILVEGLQYTGWIRVFGGWWAAWVRVDDTGVAGVVWLMGMLSVLGCNVSLASPAFDVSWRCADEEVFGTNIGATILLSRVLQFWEQEYGPVSRRTLYAAVYTLAVGSNFGAYSFV